MAEGEEGLGGLEEAAVVLDVGGVLVEEEADEDAAAAAGDAVAALADVGGEGGDVAPVGLEDAVEGLDPHGG